MALTERSLMGSSARYASANIEAVKLPWRAGELRTLLDQWEWVEGTPVLVVTTSPGSLTGCSGPLLLITSRCGNQFKTTMKLPTRRFSASEKIWI